MSVVKFAGFWGWLRLAVGLLLIGVAFTLPARTSASTPSYRPPTTFWAIPEMVGALEVRHEVAIDCQPEDQFCTYTWSLTASNPSETAGYVVIPAESIEQEGAFYLEVAPGDSQILEMQGELTPTLGEVGGFLFIPAIRSRHLLLGESSSDSQLTFHMRTGRTGALYVGQSMRVSVTYPLSWSLSVSVGTGYDFTPVGTSEGWRLSDDGESQTALVDMTAASQDAYLGFHFTLEPPVLLHGGPVVGIVLQADSGFRDFDAGVSMYLAYEMGFFDWLIGNLALQTDFESLAIIPSVQAALPIIYLMPIGAPYIGVGLPFRLAPTFDIGARLEAGMSGWGYGFAMCFDFYPGIQTDPEITMGMLIRISL